MLYAIHFVMITTTTRRGIGILKAVLNPQGMKCITLRMRGRIQNTKVSIRVGLPRVDRGSRFNFIHVRAFTPRMKSRIRRMNVFETPKFQEPSEKTCGISSGKSHHGFPFLRSLQRYLTTRKKVSDAAKNYVFRDYRWWEKCQQSI